MQRAFGLGPLLLLEIQPAQRHQQGRAGAVRGQPGFGAVQAGRVATGAQLAVKRHQALVPVRVDGVGQRFGARFLEAQRSGAPGEGRRDARSLLQAQRMGVPALQQRVGLGLFERGGGELDFQDGELVGRQGLFPAQGVERGDGVLCAAGGGHGARLQHQRARR